MICKFVNMISLMTIALFKHFRLDLAYASSYRDTKSAHLQNVTFKGRLSDVQKLVQ